MAYNAASGFKTKQFDREVTLLPRDCFHLGRQTENENSSLNPTKIAGCRSPLPASPNIYELGE